MARAEKLKAARAHIGAFYQKEHVKGWFFRTADSAEAYSEEHYAETYGKARTLAAQKVAEYAKRY